MAAEEEKKPETKLAAERLREAIDLPGAVWEDARKLAKQLQGKPILPLIGAGASVDCGMKTAHPVAERMFESFVANGGSGSLREDLRDPEGPHRSIDLGAVADALYLEGGQGAVIDALGLDKRLDWPDSDGLPEHFCSYRILSRLAREGFLSEAITLNYDCCFERGLEDEGFQFEPWDLKGRTWLDHATVVTDGTDHVQLDPRGQLVLTKAHGCAAAYRRIADEVRKLATSSELRKKLEKARNAIVIRRGQLQDWRTDIWARDLFADRARRHVILLLGVSGQDPVIHIALTRVLEEVYGHLEEDGAKPCGEPRVVAIDRYPGTVALSGLIHQGCGGRPAGEGAVTSIGVPKGQSMTAVLTAIAVEMLALRLFRETGFPLPEKAEAGVTSLMVAVPASQRWTYFLERRHGGEGFLQKANLEYAGEKGYVPFRIDPERVAESLSLRSWLRQLFKMKGDETVEEALSNSGFVASPRRGCAYMPMGITADELRFVSGAALTAAAECLGAPPELEPVLVAGEAGGAIGRVVRTGEEVIVA